MELEGGKEERRHEKRNGSVSKRNFYLRNWRIAKNLPMVLGTAVIVRPTSKEVKVDQKKPPTYRPSTAKSGVSSEEPITQFDVFPMIIPNLLL